MAISLTAGMRSNLFSLQSTSQLMEQTQLRLNTGKKVNSALDDPTSYFTARNHQSRAGELDQLKNGMSEAIQTITAANNGIESMISLLESAKATAESAKAADVGSSDASQSITLKGVELGNTITIGGDTYVASTGASATTFVKGDSDQITALNLASLINSNAETQNIDATAVNGSTISLALHGGGDMTSTSVECVSDSFSESALVSGNDELSNLSTQFNDLLDQIDKLSNDAGYKGINLLAADNLTVQFEGTNTLSVSGFNADVGNTTLADLASDRDDSTSSWGDGTGTNIDTDITSIKNAIDALESKQSTLASSLNIVKTRQTFTEEMINTLQTGADNLTLADMNEEGANMLMLQTQQTLGTTSLSMAAQAAQSVLRLF